MPVLTLSHQHPWDLRAEEAVQVQQALRARVAAQPLPASEIKTVGGVDVGFRDENARAAAVVLAFPSLERIDQAVAETPIPFPYVPGLLSFREIPAIFAALERLERLPDVLLCDGQGLAHPRRFGIACHLGVLLDHPTLGCAKSILVGKHAPLGEERGSTAELRSGDEVIGMVVRTRDRIKPVIVSIGHRIDLPSAVEIVLACGTGYKLPEPTRLADKLASRR